jgi:hypothetical protein
MDWTALLVGAAAFVVWGGTAFGFGYLARIAVERFWEPNAPQDTPEGAEDLLDVVTSLQRSHKLLQGRVNAISPPRAGTGKNGEDSEPEPAAAPQGLTRAQVLAAYKARQRGIR